MASITTINGTDYIKDSRAVINTNFDNLNTEVGLNTTDRHSHSNKSTLDLIDQDLSADGTPTFDSVQFNGGSGTQGTVSWNTDEETLDLIQNGATLQLGQETQWHCRNNTGVQIDNGTPVMATGTIGASGRITVAPMVSTTQSNAKYFLGITTEDIANGTDGKITNFGKVRGLNTTGALSYGGLETWADGEVLYLDTTHDGYLTNVAPTTGMKIPCAFVIYAHTNGTIAVRVETHDYNTPATDISHDNSTNNLQNTPTIQDAINKLQEVNVDQEAHGFVDITEATISFDDTTYTFTLTDAGSGWGYYRQGVKYEFTGNKSVVLPGTPPTASRYYIYIDSNDGTLIASTTEWSLLDDKVSIAVIVWDNSLTPKYWISDERHTCRIDKKMGYFIHAAIGTKITEIPTISNYTLQDSSADSSIQYAISQSKIMDQDYEHTISATTGGGVDNYVIFYRTAIDTYSWIENSVPFYYTPAGYINYDNAGTMTQGIANNFYTSYVLLTNQQGLAGHTVIPGRGEYTSQSDAEAEDFSLFDFEGFEMDEAIAVFQIIWRTGSAYSTTGKCRIEKINSINLSTTASGASSSIVHNDVLGLQGGTTGEYYHLTATEYTNAQNGIAYLKHNMNASVAPTITDDSSSGYAVGSIWIDTTADKAYVCLDSTTSSAVWTETTQSGGGGGSGLTAYDGVVDGELYVGKIFEVSSAGSITASKFKISTDVLPTGADIVVKLYKNGTEDASATIATTATATNGRYVANDTTFVSGSYAEDDRITIEITQVGSTVPGSNLAWSLA